MDTLTILLIAFGVAMDACAVSITNGIIIKNLKIHHALKIAFFYALFQTLMPIIGWYAGISVRNLIANIDHWIAFGLLSFIGMRMIYEAQTKKSTAKSSNPLNMKVLLLFSIATSIDALAVGFSVALIRISLIHLVIVIGTVTFLLSFFGVFIGNKCSSKFGKKIEILGGIILIGIGIKILTQHLL